VNKLKIFAFHPILLTFNKDFLPFSKNDLTLCKLKIKKMKKIYKLFSAIAILAFSQTQINAQCISTSAYGTGNVSSVPGSSVQSSPGCAFGGEYASFTFTAAGTYSFVSTGGIGNYITITNASNVLIPGAFGNSPIVVTIPATGVYRFHVSVNGPPTCATDAACHALVVWTPPVPCSATPPSTAIASSTLLCPGAALTLSTNVTYTGTGLTYAWQSSTVSAVAGFNAIPTATNVTFATTAATLTTWYRVVVTCTNGPVSATATAVQINVGAPNVTATTPQTLICGSTAPLSFTPSVSGVSFQWQSASALSGPYSSIPSGTTAAITATGITTSTFYNIVLTCLTNTLFSSVSNTLNISPAVTTTNTVPYFEGFEGVIAGSTAINFPNCSWLKTGDWATATTTLSNNRIPQSGVGYAYTAWSTIVGGDMLYTNGILLNTGTTYSASTGYVTDGLTGWTEFSMLLSTAQNTSAITNTLATIAGPINTAYAALSSTFTVPSTGIYYLSYRVVANSTPWYLSIDNISVTAPCSLNAPSVTASTSTAICQGNTANLTASGATSYSWSSGQSTSTIAVTPSVTTSYTVTGTNALSCSNTAVATITVNASPSVSISGNNSICAGNSTSLTASGSSTYTWNTGATTSSIVVTPTANTTYTASSTGTNGCTGMAMTSVTVNALPSVNAVSSNTSFICVGSTATLTAAGANTYVWNTTATTAVIAVSPTTTTSYTVTGTGANGCSANAVISQSVSTCTDINSNFSNLTSNFIVYPNPSNGIFNLQLETSTPLSLTIIEVTDVLGRVILTDKINAGNYELNLGSNVNGIYFIKAIVDGKTKTVKIVKE
jgi:hypothetical protein